MPRWKLVQIVERPERFVAIVRSRRLRMMVDKLEATSWLARRSLSFAETGGPARRGNETPRRRLHRRAASRSQAVRGSYRVPS